MLYFIKNRQTGMYIHAFNKGNPNQFLTGETYNAKAFKTYQDAFNFRAKFFGPEFVVVEGN